MFRRIQKEMDATHSATLKRRNRSFPFLLVTLALVFCLAIAPAVSAAPTAKQLKAKYVKTLTKLLPDTTNGISYCLIDMDKDGMKECLAEYQTADTGSGSVFAIYDYTSGKVKKRLSLEQYGLSKATIYLTSKSIVLYGSGRGGEWYKYYTKNSSGNYKLKAGRTRTAIAGGAAENGAYTYTDKNGEEITKSAFNKLVKKVQKGSKKAYKLFGGSYKWTHLDK